jgi:hypothetical protein
MSVEAERLEAGPELAAVPLQRFANRQFIVQRHGPHIGAHIV